MLFRSGGFTRRSPSCFSGRRCETRQKRLTDGSLSSRRVRRVPKSASVDNAAPAWRDRRSSRRRPSADHSHVHERRHRAQPSAARPRRTGKGVIDEKSQEADRSGSSCSRTASAALAQSFINVLELRDLDTLAVSRRESSDRPSFSPRSR